jgi:hypothetical protein
MMTLIVLAVRIVQITTVLRSLVKDVVKIRIAEIARHATKTASAKTITVNVFAVLGLYARMVFAYFSVRKKF